MFSTLRTRFGIPGVISVIALVFAMLGGAYAASNSGSGDGKASASATKRGPRGPRGPKGATGPIGPQGLAGVPGANGKDGISGKDGTNGNDGADGTSVTVTEEAPVVGECGDPGGIKVSSASPDAYVCNGEDGADGADGEPWVAGQAPGKVVMKGTWGVSYTASGASETIPIPISTAVPVSTGKPLGFVVLPVGQTADPNQPFGCTGTANSPAVTLKETEPGEFNNGLVCIYQAAATNFTAPSFIGGLKVQSSGGGLVALGKSTAAGAVNAYGTWAMLTP